MARPLGLFAADAHPRASLFAGRRRSRAGLLTGLFFRRFLDNDLFAPSGDMHAGFAFLLAALAAPGFFNLAWLFFTYSGPFLTPSERLLIALDHKYQFLACSMIVTALGTALAWDALSIDARDMAILGPMPVPRAVLWRAKVTALLRFLSLFAVAVNLIPTVGFPVVWLSLVPIGFTRACSVVAVHGLTSLAAAVFGFCTVLAVRSLLRLVCGPRLFRAASPVAQFVVALALIVAFLALPAYSSNARTQLASRSAAVFASPPMWFVGVYEKLTAGALYADPDLTRDSTWKFWERERLTRIYPLRKIRGLLPEAWIHPSPLYRTEEGARRRYAALRPVLDELALIGAVAAGVAVLAAGLLYFLAHVRRSRSMDTAATGISREPGWLSRPGQSLAGLLAPRRPLPRATFFFTAQALFRSPAHRMHLAAFLAVGVALALIRVAPLAHGGADAFAAPTPMLLSQQLLLAFFLLAGVRIAFTMPASLQANWLFRAAGAGDPPLCSRGVRRAVGVHVLVPLFALLVPLHAWLWGVRIAALHFAFGLLSALVLLQILLFADRKIPFTSPYVPGRGNLKTRWPFYLLGLAVFTQAFGALEYAVLPSPLSYGVSLACGSFLVAALAAANRRAVHSRDLVFDEQPEPAVQTLGLG